MWLEEGLRRAAGAGFTGMEMGRRVPMGATAPGPHLDRPGIRDCGDRSKPLASKPSLDDVRMRRCEVRMTACAERPGEGSLDVAADVWPVAEHGHEGWFVVEAGRDPRRAPPGGMAAGQGELPRLMPPAGCEVVR